MDSSAETSTKSNYRRVIMLVAIIALALGFLSYALSQSTPPTKPTTMTCMTIFPGQPLGASLRVINATTLKPIVGAIVTATSPVSGICGVSTPTMESVQLTTNSTEWYSLPFVNHGTYQIGVSYQGHSYNVTMPLGLGAYNCATLSVPTGQTNVTTTGSPQLPCSSIG